MCDTRPSLYSLINKLEDLKHVRVEESFIVTAEHVQTSIELGRDTNFLHQSASFARSLGFEGIVVPGLLLEARFSGFVARNFPNGVLAKSKEINFKRACYVGDVVTMTLLYRSDSFDALGNRTLLLGFSVKNQRNKILIDGGCSILVLKNPVIK